ncbi:MAG: FAD-dependent oxidoreductase [Legionellaceae bacterium]|nr:FAD-dependent oxidoreductase [Legionellaceae bacterium]
MEHSFYDITIVGAGIAGLYTGMRLARSPAYSEQSIGLFEVSERVGGRIKSVSHPNLELPCELGCMRYVTSQRIITNLIENHYALKKQPFDTGYVDNHIYYLRGKHLDTNTWSNVPYVLPETCRDMSPFKILDSIIDDVKKHNDVQSEIKKELIYPHQGHLQGQSLQNIGFANLITASSSHETLKFLCDSGEYYAKTINWNAKEAFPYSQSIGYKAKDDIEYWCVADGFSSLTEKISDEFNRLGGQLHTDRQLRTIEHYDGQLGKYRLVFHDKKNNQEHVIITNKIVLAIPKGPLMNLGWLSGLSELFYGSIFKNLLASVRILPVIRFALLFKTPWWETDFDGLNGHMVTDLPLRHGYYFGSHDSKHTSVFLSTIDMDLTDYWLPYIGHTMESGLLSDATIAELTKQLKIIHRKDDIETPVVGFFSNWLSESYGGGFHAWNPGYCVSTVMESMRKPFAHENIHIIGESFSGLQGWVEGALCTAEKLLHDHFSLGLDEAWLEKDYFYGY